MGFFWVNVGQKDKFDMPTAKVGRARNAPLESGVYKYSRSQMYHKKAIYKVANNKPKFDYPTTVVNVVKTSKNLFSKQKRSLRPSLGAGTIATRPRRCSQGKEGHRSQAA